MSTHELDQLNNEIRQDVRYQTVVQNMSDKQLADILATEQLWMKSVNELLTEAIRRLRSPKNGR